MSEVLGDVPTAHTFLPHCWVCATKFNANLVEERHHIIPRAYGGEDGPQVSLCSDHHTQLHEVGKRIYSGKPFTDLLSGKPDQDAKVVYLGTIACNARIATEKDPNKLQMVVVKLDGPHKQMLLDLKKVYPKKSQPSLLALALEALHARHFINRP
jgi:hypothetical protein